ncbi:hypothetical protein BB561_001966 [Smittium simulii]|uniref:C2H2-type domain-containing protein n=1 Tax=Smittium simulii TaxID=133385 RepID=A0A2T9YSC1_9FUNG|nr:hypothetical protein BB561_001966 [Smittium simulii]
MYSDDVSKRMSDYISDDDYDSRRYKHYRNESPSNYREHETDRFGRDKREISPEGGYFRNRSRSPGYKEESHPNLRERNYRTDDRYSSRPRGSDNALPHHARGSLRNRDNDKFTDNSRKGYGRSKPYDRRGRSNMADPNTFDLVVPYRYFSEWKKSQEGNDNLDYNEIHRLYEEYRQKALNKLFEMFFSAHKDEDWFIEKYKPDAKNERQKTMLPVKKEYYELFKNDLESGKLDKLTLDEPDNLSENHKNTISNENTAIDNSQPLIDTNTLFIRTVPPDVKRASLEDELSKLEGFEYLSFSEPNPNKNFHRFAWVKFKKGTDIENCLEQLKDFKIDEFQFHFSHHSSSSTAQIRVAPPFSNSPSRIMSDLNFIRNAITVLDNKIGKEVFSIFPLIQSKMDELKATIKDEYNTSNSGASESTKSETNIVADDVDISAKDQETSDIMEQETENKEQNSEKDDSPEDTTQSDNINKQDTEQPSDLEVLYMKKELDISIEYLRRVHFYCYYCGTISDNPQDFSRKCASHHYRKPYSASHSTSTATNGWAKNNDSKNKLIIDPPSISEIHKQGGKSYEDYIDELKDYIKLKDKGRFRCVVCKKLFKGESFIIKHISTKHSNLVNNDIFSDIDFFNNFVLDAPSYLILGAGQMLNSMGNMGFNNFSGNHQYQFVPPYGNRNNQEQYQAGQAPFVNKMAPFNMPFDGAQGNNFNGRMMMQMPPVFNNYSMGPSPMAPMMGLMPGFPNRPVQYMNPSVMGWQQPMVIAPFNSNFPMNPNMGPNVIGNMNPIHAPIPQMAEQSQDPRGVRSYVDLDAPGDAEPDYGF